MKCSGCLRTFDDLHGFKTCEKCRLKVKQYHKKNKEKLKEKRKLYCDKNIHTIKSNKHEYYINNKNIILKKQKENRIKNKYKYALTRAKQNARMLNIDFNLDIEYIENIWPTDNICYMLKVPMVYGTKYAPSVDRIDCNKGYVKNNVQIISHRANTIKNNASIEELEMVINYIYKCNNGDCFDNGSINDYDYLKKKLIRKKAYCKKNKINFNITYKDLIIPKKCPVLGIELSTKNSKKCDNSPSIDRINPNNGYVVGNVMIISLKANRIKSDANINELSMMLYNWKHMALNIKNKRKYD